MAGYRRRNENDLWHWCRNCLNDPKSDYETCSTRPVSKLCDECKEKEEEDTCMP